jgi:hypothetical protein
VTHTPRFDCGVENLGGSSPLPQEFDLKLRLTGQN